MRPAPQPCSCLPRLFSLRNEAQAFINASFLVCQSTEYSHSQFTQSDLPGNTLSTEPDLPNIGSAARAI